MRKFFILNGPARCGKDTVSEILKRELVAAGVSRSTAGIAISEELKRRTHALYGVRDPATGDTAHAYWFESRKDEPIDEFFGVTPRRIYIEVSERILKPVHGPDILGRLALRPGGIVDRTCDSETTIIDAGFRDEMVPLIEKFGGENFTLLRIHRQGADFTGDSRSYFDLTDLGVRTMEIHNPTPKGVEDVKGIDKLGEVISELVNGLRERAPAFRI